MTVKTLTFKTIGPKLHCWFWKTGLVSVAIHGPDTKQTSPALNSGYRDRMSHTAVRHPAIVASVKPLSPRGVELARGRKDGIPLFALFTGLLKSHLTGHGSIIDLTLIEAKKRQINESRN